MLIFKGTDTQKRIKYNAEGKTAIDLYNNLVSKDIISIVDGDPYEEAQLKKAKLTHDDFKDEDGELDCDKLNEWLSYGERNLTDEEILEVIAEQNGNAYYQKIIDTKKAEELYRKIHITIDNKRMDKGTLKGESVRVELELTDEEVDHFDYVELADEYTWELDFNTLSVVYCEENDE